MTDTREEAGLWGGLVGDGRPLLSFVGLALLLAGVFTLFIAGTGHFLPHDAAFLGLTAEQLCAHHECRIVHFMIHDRVSFGGAVGAVGLLYLWLDAFPLKHGEAWAWWLLALSGLVGFASFLAYLGFGYLDTWHAAATLAILPAFLLGLALSRRTLRGERGWRSLRRGGPAAWGEGEAPGRLCLLLCALGMVGGGAVIMTLGMTWVFVPEDLAFMRVTAADLQSLNARLIPLIAHDRAGFGGAVCCAGLLLLGCAWRAPRTKSLLQALTLAGAVGFGAAVGVHPAVGYNDLFHMLPPLAGTALLAAGLVLLARRPATYRTPEASNRSRM